MNEVYHITCIFHNFFFRFQFISRSPSFSPSLPLSPYLSLTSKRLYWYDIQVCSVARSGTSGSTLGSDSLTLGWSLRLTKDLSTDICFCLCLRISVKGELVDNRRFGRGFEHIKVTFKRVGQEPRHRAVSSKYLPSLNTASDTKRNQNILCERYRILWLFYTSLNINNLTNHLVKVEYCLYFTGPVPPYLLKFSKKPWSEIKKMLLWICKGLVNVLQKELWHCYINLFLWSAIRIRAWQGHKQSSAENS